MKNAESVADRLYPPINETPEEIQKLLEDGKLQLPDLKKAISHYKLRIGALVSHGIMATQSKHLLREMERIKEEHVIIMNTFRKTSSPSLTVSTRSHPSLPSSP
jgi:hypothetical protein